MQSLCACLVVPVLASDCVSVFFFGLCTLRKHVQIWCDMHVSAFASGGDTEHHCAVLAGLAVQHVEQAQTCFHAERE